MVAAHLTALHGALTAKTGDPSHFVGGRVLEHAEGPERGSRIVELRNGGPLLVRLSLDRALDIAELWADGLNVGWVSPAPLARPGLHAPGAEAGWGRFRDYGGALITCGLDHYGGPAELPADRHLYPPITSDPVPVHGLISTLPARLTRLKTDWAAGTVVCVGETVQARLFGDRLRLIRTITLPIGGRQVIVEDVVVNDGGRPARHRMLYHCNAGWPLLDEGAEVRLGLGAGSREPGWQRMGAPDADMAESVFEHPVLADAGGMGRIALVNLQAQRALEVAFSAETLPRVLQWQCRQPGIYATGLEPCTHGGDGPEAALWLSPQESRRYRLELSLLAGADALACLTRA